MSYGGTLRVLPRGTGMVPVYEVQGQIRRFHGWKHDAALGVSVVNPTTGTRILSGGFRKLRATSEADVITVPNTVEYRRHLKDGDLWPADEATTREVGVPFDPTFGGEHSLAPAPTPRAGG